MPDDGLGDVLEAVRDALGDPPRELDADALEEFTIRVGFIDRIAMMLGARKKKAILDDAALLAEEGTVVWGAFGFTPEEAFDPANKAPQSCEILYSPDPVYDRDPDPLRHLARELVAARETKAKNKAVREFVAEMRSQLVRRTIRLRVPPELTDDTKVYVGETFLDPKHLPGGVPAVPIIPVLIAPKETEAVVPVPSGYWPKSWRRFWKDTPNPLKRFR